METAVELLLQNSADINCVDFYGDTPVFDAIKNKKWNVVKKLLASGREIKIFRDVFQNTSLHLAARHADRVQWVKMFLSNDINAQNSGGLTALHLALFNPNKTVRGVFPECFFEL